MLSSIRPPRSICHLSSLLLATATLFGCSKQDAPTGDLPPPAVSVYPASVSEVGLSREFVARTEANKTVNVRPQVEGPILKRGFVEGDVVEKDQLLFEIDPKPFAAALRRAQANLASMKASRDRAVKDAARGQELAPQGFISQSELDQLQANKLQAEANVEGAEAELKTAEINLGYTKIIAPFKGEVGRTAFEVGNVVGPGVESLVTLTNIDPIYVSFQLEEETYVRHLQTRGNLPREEINKLFDLSLRLPDETVYDQSGGFNFTDTSVDRQTGTVNLRAEFPNPEGKVIPGLFVTLKVESTDKRSLPLVPQAAVQQDQTGHFVLIVDQDNTVKPVVVKTGQRIQAMWAIEEGLQGGENIIVEGLQKVQPGAAVQPVPVNVDPASGGVTPIESNAAGQAQGANQ